MTAFIWELLCKVLEFANLVILLDFLRYCFTMALMVDYVTRTNFTTKLRFSAKFFALWVNERGYSFQLRFHRNLFVQNSAILKFQNVAGWWNVLMWRKHAWGLLKRSWLFSVLGVTNAGSNFLNFSGFKVKGTKTKTQKNPWGSEQNSQKSLD